MSEFGAIWRFFGYALKVSVLGGPIWYAPSAAGQTENEDVVEITVTGSRLVRQDYQAASPITTVDAELFKETAAPTIETVLNTLPQFVPAITSTSNNPSNRGQANVSLRGLGVNRTLVLLDGRRITPSRPEGVVDLNLIPPTIIQSVEVITGGASAVYGSDAIAGVVNIRTREFVGLEVSANYGVTSENDGERLNLSITGGLQSRTGDGYAFGSFSWADRSDVETADRSFSNTQVDWDGDSFEPLGSTSIPQGRWDSLSSNRPTQEAVDTYFSAQDPSYIAGSITPGNSFGFNPDGSLFSTAPVFNFTGDTNDPLQPVNPANYTYNLGEVSYLEMPLERKSFFGKTGLAINESTEIFAQIMWANYTVDALLPATPTTSLYIRPDNPNLNPDIVALLTSRPNPAEPFAFRKRFLEMDPRQRHVEYDAMQVVAGASGDLPLGDKWIWDAYLSWGSVQIDDAQLGSMSRSAFYDLSLADDHGASICGSPMNPFGIASIARDCWEYFRRDAYESTTLTQTIAEAFVRGNIFTLPAGEIETAIGVMYKQDDFSSQAEARVTATGDVWGIREVVDPVTGSVIGDISGWGSPRPPLSGMTISREIYAEANFPIVSDSPIARHLDLTLGIRGADHSSAGNMVSYKAESIWDIRDSFTVRGGYERAVRAPNVNELFRQQTAGNSSVGLGDPCSNDFSDPAGNVLGAQGDPRARDLCIAQGIPDAAIDDYFFSGNLFSAIGGGNPNVQEEIADTYTVGIVFGGPEQGLLAGLVGSVDYYQIEIEDAIGPIRAAVSVERCFDPRFNPNLVLDNFYCDMFTRNPGTGVVRDALQIDTNIAEAQVKGIDYQIEYSAEIGAGLLDVKWIASNLLNWKQATLIGEPLQEFAGTASGSWDVLPEWKFMTSVSYTWSGFDALVRWRRIGESQDLNVPDFTLNAVDYIDLIVGYGFRNNGLEGLSFRVGVNNIGDGDPVIYPSWQQANTDPAMYDVLGRRYFMSATYSFE